MYRSLLVGLVPCVVVSMSSVSCAARPKTAGSGSACDSGITVKLPTSVPREMRISSDEAQAWTLPTELDIQTQGKRLPDRIVLTATIRNTGTTPQKWVFLTGGLPGGTNPIGLDVAAPTKPVESTHMEVYPAPEQVPLQPGEEVVYQVTTCQDEYVSAWPRPVKVDWSVEAWGANRKTGSMQL